MKPVSKYIYGYSLQTNRGKGWTSSDDFFYTLKEARQQLRAYRENSPYPVRIVGAREPNPEHLIESLKKQIKQER